MADECAEVEGHSHQDAACFSKGVPIYPMEMKQGRKVTPGHLSSRMMVGGAEAEAFSFPHKENTTKDCTIVDSRNVSSWKSGLTVDLLDNVTIVDKEMERIVSTAAVAERRLGVNLNPKLRGKPDVNDDHREHATACHALRITLPAVSFTLSEFLEVHANGSAVWMNGIDDFQAFRSVTRQLNH